MMKIKSNCLLIATCLFLVFCISCSSESDKKDILTFAFNELEPPVSGEISSNNITATIPDDADIENLAPTIKVSDKASISPASGVAQDFSSQVNYTVTAEDNSNRTYIVSVHFEGEPKVDINWDGGTNTPDKIAWGSAATVGDKLYLIGGTQEGNATAPVSSVYEYDPVTDSWESKSDMLMSRWAHSSVTFSGKIYVMGGLSQLIGPAIKTSEVYDPATDTWEALSDLPRSRAAHGACLVDGKIYLIGGEEQEPASGTFMNSVDVYDPFTDSWTEASPIPVPTAYLSAASVSGKAYAFGGAIASGGEGVANVYEYDPNSQVWTSKSDIKTPRWSLTSSAINDLIFCIGGAPNGMSSGVSRVEVYSPEYDLCITTTGLGVKCYGQAATTWNGKIVVFGGCTAPPPTYEVFTNVTQIGTPLITKN